MSLSSVYRVIQSSATILKEVVGEIIWSRQCKHCFYRSPSFPNYDFLRWFCFYYCDGLFCKVKTIVVTQYVSRVPYLQRKIERSKILRFVAFLTRHVRVLHLEYFSNLVMGNCQICWRNCFSSLLTVLHLSVLPLTFCTEFPSNDPQNTEWHISKNFKIRNRCVIYKNIS
jgi:hypothetical protein